MARRQSISSAISSDAAIRYRLIAIGVLLVVLLGLVVAALWLRGTYAAASSQEVLPSSALDGEIAGSEFEPDASAELLLAKATSILEELQSDYPSNPKALSAAARKLYQLEEAEEAARKWRQALEIDEGFVEALYGLGLIAFDQDRFEDAAYCFEDVRVLGQQDPRVPVLLADSYMHLGEARKAVLILEQHIATEQTSISAWLLLGQAYQQLEEYERAIDCYEKVLAFDSEAKDAVYGMARTLAALGRREESQEMNNKFRQLAQQAREENAANAAAFRDRNYAAGILAQVYADVARVEKESGQVEKAEAALLRAVKLAPDSLEFIRELQSLYLQLYRPVDAHAATERILELEPDNPEQLIRLGMLSAELQQTDAAIAAFRKAIQLDPDNEVCQQAARLLSQLES